MKKGFLILLLLQNTFAFSQGINNLWLMGYECCQPRFWPMNLNFSSGNLVIDTVIREMNIECTNGVICDKHGSLLFYSNGVYIANALNDTMQNGSGLNPCQFTTNHLEYGLTIPQANLIIPFPRDSMKYYLFHESSDDYGFTYSSFFLYNSIIDMSLNSGLGAVMLKNSVLLNDTLVIGRLTACKHSNGRDWWLVALEYRTGNIFKFLITPYGIHGPYLQYLQTPRDNYVGQAVFSQQGKKFAYYDPFGDLDIFDFDRCTGDFSNRLHIDINDSAETAGAAFSPNGRYLYISSMLYVYQFDLLSSDINASRYTVAVWDSFYSPNMPSATTFYLAQLAPDGKIYINCPNSTLDMHVINYPDSAGPACNFCQHCIHLPAYNGFTIPNHPNYFLGKEAGTICDSLTNDVSTISNAFPEYNLYPNPARDKLYIPQKNNSIKTIKIINSIGQSQHPQYFQNKSHEYVEVDISLLSSGVYFIEMLSDKEKIVRRFIKE